MATITVKKHGIVSYVALAIGIVCFVIVFTPLRIGNIGSLLGDYIMFFCSGLGILLSIVGLVKQSERNLIPIVGLILSSSVFIFWLIVLFLLFNGQLDLAP